MQRFLPSPHRNLEGKLLEIFIVGNVGLDSLANDLLRLLAVLFPPFLVFRLGSGVFLLLEVSTRIKTPR